MSEEDRQRALTTSRWALVTHPQPNLGLAEHLRRWAKQLQPVVEDMTWLEKSGGFAPAYETTEFTVYRKRS